MAIAKTTARAACPLFSGRGLNYSGFTLALPQKEYLSCEPTNMESEKAILGVYNYDLADRPYYDSTDVVAFQIYCKTGANIANVTTGRNIHGFDVWVEMDVDDFEVTTNLRNADIRAARVQCQADYGVSGVVMGMYLNSKLLGGSTYLGRYLEYTSSYGAITLEVRSETSGTGTVTAGDGTNYGMAGIVVTYKGSNALTGNYHGIVLHEPYEGGAISGSSVGIYFMNTAIMAGTDFDIGIDFGDSHVVTAIDIGTCTTGIAITGSTTDGIVISGACSDNAIEITGACTDSAIKIIGTAIIASGEQAIFVNCTSETAAVNGVWVTLKSTVSTGDMSGFRTSVSSNRGTSGGPNIRALRAKAQVEASKYATLLTAGLFETNVAAGSVNATTIETICVQWSGGASLIATNRYGIKMNLQTRSGDTVSGTDVGIYINNECHGATLGKLMDAAITVAASNWSPSTTVAYTVGLSITAPCTDGMKISSAGADGIEISGAQTAYAINISTTQPETGIYVKARKKGINVYTIMDETISASQYSLHIETNTGASAAVTGSLEGMRLEIYTNSGSTISGDIFGIHMANYLEKAPAGDYYLMRLAETNTVATVKAALWIYSPQSDYFANFSGPDQGGWSKTTDKAVNSEGFLKVVIGGVDRYIALYHGS